MGFNAPAINTLPGYMSGRRNIYASFDDITPENVIYEVNRALAIHTKNLMEEEYLYWYRRGITPILNRTKERNSFVCNRINVNFADEICTFKNGYFISHPCTYVSRNDSNQNKVDELNEFLYRSGKQEADNNMKDWFHTVGRAALFVEPNDDPDVPYLAHAVDPRSAFVVYSMKPGNKPVMGVNMVVVDDTLRLDVYTLRYVFRISGTVTGKLISPDPNYIATAVYVDAVEPNVLGKIPIIEYDYNNMHMASFEAALPLIDAASDLISNRLDGIAQFIQSLIVLYNAELPEGEDANSMKEKGLLLLKSVGENRQEIKILSEQLDQTQSQTLMNCLQSLIFEICAMPRTGEGTTYDTTGAAVLASQGFMQADLSAKCSEDLFRKSNRYFDEIVLEILRRKGVLDISVQDFELNFVRSETQNIQSKAQAFQTLMAAGLHPELAAAKSGISNDPVSDIKMSEKYIQMVWGDPDKVDEVEEKTNGQGEAKITEEDNFNGENETGGAI